MLKVHRAQVIFLSLRRATKLFFIMATGNMLLGQARGSVGDLTFYRRSGKQVTRAKATQVSNPKSTAQMIQRMIFATAAAAYSRLRSICDHSFENVQYGAKSQARFMSLNLERLRAFFPTSVDPVKRALVNAVDDIAYSDKKDALYSGQGLIISDGSLPQVRANLTGQSGIFTGFGNDLLSPGSSISAVLSSLNASVGDQITIVCLIDIGNVVTCVKSRYVVDANATAEQLAAAWDPTGAAAAFDPVKTKVGDCRLIISGDNTYISPLIGDETPIAAGVIISRQEGNQWLRSKAILFNTTDEGAIDNAEVALYTWQNVGTSLDVESERYLNNADV